MGNLYLIATPIGNLEDISIRAINTLLTVDYIACEDTRRTGQLLEAIKNKFTFMVQFMKVNDPKFISFYDEIEEKRVPEIIALLAQDKNIALVSDSGTPLICDPGFKLVKECLKRGIKIISLPGPSSVITALTSSGLPTNNFLFMGYLPNKSSKRIKLFESLKALRHLGGGPDSIGNSPDSGGSRINPTIIFFESPHRLKESLQDLQEVFGDIDVVITRELTKLHEEIFRGKISETLIHFKEIKGEIVLLFRFF